MIVCVPGSGVEKFLPFVVVTLAIKGTGIMKFFQL
jgi:hypothetical protein